MILKTFTHILASLFLLSTLVISQDEDLLESTAIAKIPAQSPLIPPPLSVKVPPPQAPVKVPPPVPIKVPPPQAPVKVSPPQAPVPIKVPPPQAPVKVPPPQAPVPIKVPPPQAPVPVKVPPPQAQKPPSPSVKPPVIVPPIKPPVPVSPPHPPRNTKECYPPCVVRCKLHSRKNVCLRACVTCCDRCKCVPPGQYGNKEMCGKCYVDMTTHGGKTKCP